MGEVIYLFGKPEEPPQKNDALQACTPVLVYFPSFGRNAWHSTRIARYQNGGLQASWGNAEAYIGERLKQGANWGFQVLPAFHLQFTETAYLLCEINTQTPFRHLLDSSILRLGKWKEKVLAGLSPNSPYWSSGQSLSNGIIVQQTDQDAMVFRRYLDRTEHPRQVFTIGSYKRRKSQFGDWAFEFVEPIFRPMNLDFYETALRQLDAAPIDV